MGDENKGNFVVLAIVAIVAIIGLVVLLRGTGPSQPAAVIIPPVQLDGNVDGNIGGQSSYSCLASCLGQYNSSFCLPRCGY